MIHFFFVTENVNRIMLGSLPLGKRKHQIKVHDLNRLMVYMLGHRPDEFGLAPDSGGFVSIKELLKAINEEPGWHYVRQAHIHEVLMGKDRFRFQFRENEIRASERHWRLDLEKVGSPPPKTLYVPVRRRAHPVVMERGLTAREGNYLVLSPDKEMALRIGRRKDQRPVVLEVMASSASDRGVVFHAFGGLFLGTRIPAECIAGPPVSRELLEARSAAEAQKHQAAARPVDFTAGTFLLEADRGPDLLRRSKGKKRKGWKEESRKVRRGKRR